MDRFDLNLVRTLVAIYETRSVTRAAERLDLTQSSVSHALSRLRQAYGDHLFVRQPRGLEPTGVASQLYERFSHHLAGIEETLEAREAFDPAATTRRFRIALSDVGMLALGSTILEGLHGRAPRSEIEIGAITDTALEELAVGRIDVVVGNLPALNTVTRNLLLFNEHYVCVLSDHHPSIGDALTLKQFAAAAHVVVATPTPGNQLVDAALAEHHLARRVAIRAPYYSELPRLLAESGLICVLPSRIAAMHSQGGGLRMLALPFDIPAFDVRLYWHVRSTTSKPHVWLVEALTALLREADGPARSIH